jgi:hypothetical protein
MKNRELIKYYKRFANGEQYIEINKSTNKIITLDKAYLWQEQRVYNHIKPLLDVYGKDFSEKELYGKNGLVALLEPYQRSYNEIMNQHLHYINMATNGFMTVEDGSIDIDDLCEEGLCPSKVLVYRQGSNEPKVHTSELKTESYRQSCEFCLNRMYQIVANYVEAKNNQKKKEN